MATPSRQPLPSKEAALFRQLVKLYESKQYKKAVKAADQILKKFPEHGETLAMKGLTLNYMDKKDEAYDYVRKGLRADLKSHVCWHVYGLVYRSDNNYSEAIKCYLNALRLDKDNAQILRDLAMLQIQMRDVPGFVDTRYRLLQLRSNNRNNWVSFAVAHHLDGNYDMAVNIIRAYESTLDEVPASEAYEHSELLAYKAQVLAEGGQAEAALALLDAQADKLKDRLGVMHSKAELLLQLGRAGEAEAVYRQLLDLNPDDYRVHEGLHRCLGIRPPAHGHTWQQQESQQPGSAGAGAAAAALPTTTAAVATTAGAGLWSAHSGKKRRLLQQYSPEERDKLGALYDSLAQSYRTSLAVQRMPLDFLEGDAFVSAADAYVRRHLLRGIPSLFSDLQPLYADPAKAAALGQLFEGYAAHLRAHGALPPLIKDGGSSSSSDSKNNRAANGPDSSSNGAASAANGSVVAANGTASSSSSDGEDNPLTWVLHYLTQHYDRLGARAAALEASEAALGLAPRGIELHLARAKVLKHAGDALGAAVAADAARRLDLADRFTNSMAVKALFAAGCMELGEATAMLFTRDGDQLNNLYDMQHMWYEVRCGDAYLAGGQLGKALKKYTGVAKHFADFTEDQFDFHSYCVRKLTLRAYLGLLRMEDRLHHHPFYMRAALGAVAVYLELQAAPAAAAAAEEAAEAQLAAMSPEERKKEKLRRKKEEKRREREAEAAAAAAAEAAKASSSAGGAAGSEGGAANSNSKGAKKKSSSKAPDPDPDGAKLAATADPLAEATKFVSMLKQAAPQHLETQLAAAKVYGLKGRPLLEAAAVKRAVALAGRQHPDVHRALVRFGQRVSASPPANPAVAQLVAEVLTELLDGAADTAAYAAAYSKQAGAGAGLRQQAAAAEMAALLDPGSRAVGIKQLLAAAPTAAAAAGSGSSDGSSSSDVSRQLLADAVEVHKLLLSGPLADAAAAAEWKGACAAAFERSTYFGGAAATPLERLNLNAAQLKEPLAAAAL